MSIEFYVGQEVCCINKDGWYSLNTFSNSDGPEYGAICTIHSIGDDPMIGTVLRLNGWTAIDDEFKSDLFRPVVKTDISVFTAMLAPSPQRVNA